MKQISLLLIVCTFISCEYSPFQKKEIINKKPIATVLNKHLYKEDISTSFYGNLSKKDSVVLAKSLINKWAVKQLLLKKATENSTQKEAEEIKRLVLNYKESLLLNSYKEKLIKQQLDTVISSQEIVDFYKKINLILG